MLLRVRIPSAVCHRQHEHEYVRESQESRDPGAEKRQRERGFDHRGKLETEGIRKTVIEPPKLNGTRATLPLETPAAAPLLWMRPVQVGDLEALSRLAASDDHEPAHPTHVFLKDDEIVGCASVWNVPLVLPWFHTEKCCARDSRYFINQMENLVASLMPANGHGTICVPFADGSPFQAYIKRLGYVNAGQFSLTFKKVK